MLGFNGSHTDSSLFIFQQGNDCVYLLMNVDDIIITRSNDQLVTRIIALLATEFHLKDQSKLHYFLGIKVISHKDGLLLSEQKYMHDLRQKTQMESAKGIKTPMAS